MANMELSSICTTLESIISKSFGPLGLQNLLTTDTGQVIVTSDGLSVLQSLHLSHPVAKLILDSLKKSTSYTGDGCKTFVLCLAETLREIEKDCENQTSHFSSYSNVTRIKYCRAFHDILIDLLPKMADYVKTYLLLNTDSSTYSSFIGIVEQLLKSVLHSHFPVAVTNCFTRLLLDMLNSGEQTTVDGFAKILQNVCDNFTQLCIKVTGLQYTASAVLPSYVIQRDFAVQSESIHGEVVKFIIIQCALEELRQDNNVQKSLRLSDSDQLKSFISHQFNAAADFIKMCKRNGISLVLCSEKIPEFILGMFKKNTISVIHFVPAEDLLFLQDQMGKQPVVDMHEIISCCNIFEAQSVQQTIVGGRKVVHIRIATLPRTLLVCGLSERFCSQVILVLQKTLISLSHCFVQDCELPNAEKIFGDESHSCHENRVESEGAMSVQKIHTGSNLQRELTLGDQVTDQSGQDMPKSKHKSEISLQVIYGGGLFEEVAAKFFEDQSKTFRSLKNEHFYLACKILSKSLLYVSKTLHRNMCNNENSRFIKQQQKTFQLLADLSTDQSESARLQWIKHCRMKADGCLEPVSSKVHILTCVVQLAKQLLRIDSILGISNS